jgi:hypothetical protein
MPNYNNENDNDNEYIENNDMELNESALTDISLPFRKQVIKTKQNLYNSVVFEKPAADLEAQETKVLHRYIQLISLLHKIFKTDNIEKLKTVIWSNPPWNQFPRQCHEDILTLLNMYYEFLKENQQTTKRIPYEDYIHNSFHVYPYHQSDSFEINDEDINFDSDDEDN